MLINPMVLPFLASNIYDLFTLDEKISSSVHSCFTQPWTDIPGKVNRVYNIPSFFIDFFFFCTLFNTASSSAPQGIKPRTVDGFGIDRQKVYVIYITILKECHPQKKERFWKLCRKGAWEEAKKALLSCWKNQLAILALAVKIFLLPIQQNMRFHQRQVFKDMLCNRDFFP